MSPCAARVAGALAAVAAALSAATALAQQPPAAPPAAKPAGAEGPAVMIVFDGSGSMWGRIDGDNKTNKFSVAREALRQALEKPGLTARVGLMSFGHRRKADCNDIEIIVPPQAGEPDRIMAPLGKLNPRGKGPLSNSLREAAKALAGQKVASIVLVHDNADNCQQDACAAADEIAKAQPGLAIHAIGAGLEPDDVKRMACVARGGGKFVNAENADQVTTAIGEAMQAALKSPAPSKAPAGAAPTDSAPQAAAAPKAPASPQGAAGISSLGVAARLGASGPAVDVPLRWRVTRVGEAVPLLDTEAKEILKPLPAGKYEVEARIGQVVGRQTVDVPAGAPASAILALEAGRIRYALRNGKAADGIAGTVVSLAPVGADGKPAGGPPMLLSRASTGDLFLAPGTYMLSADQGAVHRETKLTVAAGDVRTEEVQLATGRLAVTAQAQEGGPVLDQAMFIVSVDDPDAPQGLREVARSGSATPEFVLPAGSYQVTARVDTTEARQRIAVSAGDLVRAAVVLGLGRIQVTHTLDAALVKALPNVTTRVTRIDGDPRVVARGNGLNPSFALPAGRYRVESAIGDQNARALADLDLKAGGGVTVTMRIDTARVQMRPGGAALLPTQGDMLWEIRDAKGRVVWRTIQPEPKALLIPGRYTIRSETRGRVVEQVIDVAAGEARNVSGSQP